MDYSMGNSIEILERFIRGKRADQSLNEDGLVVTDDYVIVIDGASSAASYNGLSGGLVARRLIEARGKELADMEGIDAVRALNEPLYDAQKNDPVACADPSMRLMASIVMYSVKKRQIWNYGDCPFLINGKRYQFDKKIDVLNADVRSFVNQAELSLGKTVEDLLKDDVGLKFVKPFLNYQPIFANKKCEFGFPSMDGFDINEELFECYDVAPGDEIVLATDGYPLLCSDLRSCEENLARTIAADPLCIGEHREVKACYEGLESYDDRTYIRFIVK